MRTIHKNHKCHKILRPKIFRSNQARQPPITSNTFHYETYCDGIFLIIAFKCKQKFADNFSVFCYAPDYQITCCARLSTTYRLLEAVF